MTLSIFPECHSGASFAVVMMSEATRNLEPSRAQSSAPLTRIERVLLLQGISLFKFCSAEEIVRIASIAAQATFAAGEQVYRNTDPAAALYCVVEGEVVLEHGDGSEDLVKAGDTFGVLEILSGRLRQAAARAVTDTRALRIEADDFFDLLSNNVEIVRALFREVLDENRPRNGGGLL